MKNQLERYGIIEDKNPREILLLRGKGCSWRKCRFCDYHLDFSRNQEANYLLNKAVLQAVTGKFAVLEIINSGSFIDLDEKTMSLIKRTCVEKNIKQIHFESHWNHREDIKALRGFFSESAIIVKMKIGIETFDYQCRETTLLKGIDTDRPEGIAEYFDECCLLFGLTGQTVESMKNDLETGLKYFDRVCVNIMVDNTTPIKADPSVIEQFRQRLYTQCKENPRIDILMENTDFGVGEVIADEK